MHFKDKVIVITGAAGGMGQAIAWRFGHAGSKLALLDIHPKAIEQLEEKLKKAAIEAVGFKCDVTDPQACQEAMNQLLDHFGKIDVLINNAGITHRSAFQNTQIQVFRRVMEVNFFGALHCTKACLDPLIQTHGLIIVISSIAGFSPLLGRSGYSASKHALHGLFESLRTELKNSGVDVMMVCPGFTATPIEKNALDGEGHSAQHPRSTTGRVATPQEVAGAIYRGAIQRKRLLVLSTVGKLAYFVSKYFPARYEKIMAKRLKHELQSEAGN